MRRTPLTSTTPLRRRTPLQPAKKPLARAPLARKTPLTPARPAIATPKPGAVRARRGDTGPTRRVTVLLWERAGGRCEICGRDLVGVAASRHHRQPRGMGGRPRARLAGGDTRPDVNALSNLMLLCGTGTVGCHGWIEANRTHAYGMGWLVPRSHDPAEIPLMIAPSVARIVVDGQPVKLYLTDDGDYALGSA